MAKSFSAQVDDFILKCKLHTEAVVKTAAQAVVNDASTQGPSVKNPAGGEGGRMPVDTGFLRNSIGAAIGSMPSGPSAQKTDKQGNLDDVYLAIAKMQMGETLYVGWSANYAPYMEAMYGFRDAAVQKWPQHVAAAVAEARRRIP